jgi:hypothetical protein
MGTHFRLVRLVPWALVLVLLPAALMTLPGSPFNGVTRPLPTPTSPEDARPLAAPPRFTSDLAAHPNDAQPASKAQPVARRNERAASDDEQRRLMMYLILRSATGRYPFAILR